MKNAIITGATGMIGGIILRHCLEASTVNKVTVIGRRSLGISHPKLVEVLHEDFSDFLTIEEYFKNQDMAFFCLGVYTGTVSTAVLEKITVDFTKVFADVLYRQSPQANFCFLSGQGADQEEKSRIPFARFKGIAENYLMAKSFGALHIFRPSYIYPVEKRAEPNFSYRVFRWLYPVFRSLLPQYVITSEALALGMFKKGMFGEGQEILENEAIKKVQ